MSESFDLVVIGGGNAGMGAAAVAREAGWSVALVEADLLGGTCPNRGCVPKKVLVAAAEVVDAVRRAQGHGVAGSASLDWAALQRARHAIVDELPQRMADSLEKEGAVLIRGHAAFSGPREVTVSAPGPSAQRDSDGRDASTGRVLSAKKVLIATGSVPRPLSFPGATSLATSADVLSLPSVPASAAFIGAGVIAFELGHVLARAGCKVTLLHDSAKPLPRVDADAVAALVAYSRSLGIDVILNAHVTAVSSGLISYTLDGTPQSLQVDLAIHGAGRVPNVAGLALARAGVSSPDHGPDLRLLQNVDVAIVGDAAHDLPQLSPLATSLGKLVAGNLVHGRHDAPDLRFVPSCVFTIPTLSQVGLTEAEATAQGRKFRVALTPGMTSWISARTHHEALAFSKVLVEDGTDQILGAHLIGHGSESNIHLFALAMAHGLPASALASFDTAYPTYAADLRFLL